MRTSISTILLKCHENRNSAY